MTGVLTVDYRNLFFESLKTFLENEQYFDVFILCKNEMLIGAHKIILCSASKFFKNKFKYEDPNSKTNTVLMTDVDVNIMKIIIKFIYSGILSVTKETVQDLFITADFLGLTLIVAECCEFMRLNFDPTNIIGIHDLARQMNCKTLEEKSDQFRNSKFLEVVANEEFLEMPLSSLTEYLSSSNLHVESEQQVFEAAIKWTMHDTKRIDLLFAVMDVVRMPLLSQKFLKCFNENCSNVKLKLFLSKYISETSSRYGHQLSPVQRNMLAEMYTFRKSIKKTTYVIGGHVPQIWSDSKTLNSIAFFDSKHLKTSNQLGQHDIKLNEARSGHCVAVVDKKVFVFGGEDNAIMLNSAECWDLNDSQCVYLPPMGTPRLWAAACSVSNLVYIFGGLIDGATTQRNIDIFDTWNNTWLSPVNMPENFNACHGLGVIFVNGLIYIIGGINQYSMAEDICLAYNPVTENFDEISRMHAPRARFGISHLNNLIYVAGGIDEIPLTSVERYSIKEDRWDYITPMFYPRFGLGMVIMEGELFVLGGETKRSHFAENYKPDTNMWVLLDCDLCRRRDFCMTVV